MNTSGSLFAVSHTMLARLSVLMLCAVLAACTGGGEDPEAKPDTSVPEVDVYNGPAPETTDIQRFKNFFWENVRDTDRCGSCHISGQQSPEFARSDDVNLAYEAIAGYINFTSPEDSVLVEKVAGGHHCWAATHAVCEELLVKYIENWKGDTDSTTVTIELKDPPVRNAGDSKNFPESSLLFGQTVHPLLTEYCASCHAESARTPQAPYFATADVDAAYLAAQTKMNLDTPAESRIVLRLRNESHNCWSDCAANSNELEAAVTAMANQISATPIAPELVKSRALRLQTDGIASEGGGRYDASVIAKFEFKEGSGSVASDTSTLDPAMDLTLYGQVEWVGGGGVQVVSGRVQADAQDSKKLFDKISITGEYSIEAWVAPANVTQEDAPIVSYSGSSTRRNFTLAQTLYNYDFYNRTEKTSANGDPALSTIDDDERAQATLQHVVVTFDPTNGRRIYVNGELAVEDAADGEATGGSLAQWSDTFAFVLGNEVSGNQQWQGVIRMVAIHNRALTLEQINKNTDAGVGEKYYLLFGLHGLVDMSNPYLVFEVSQFDSYSYLFNAPFFINLGSTAEPAAPIAMRGIRIGLNGKELSVGQAYRTIDAVVNEADYEPGLGQPLSNIGTVVALEKGAETDEFFLTFEQLGANQNVSTDPVPATPVPIDGDPKPDVGMRTFEEINATMSELTGISPTELNVKKTYGTVKQQLPTQENIEGFLSAQQMAVTQLAVEYCNALVEDTTLRAAFFPGFNFSASATTAYAAGQRDLLIDPLVNKLVGGAASQPGAAEVETELNNLIDKLIACGGSCAANRTEQVAKAACGAVLGSAVTLMQ
jgi:hypothetical protein